MRSCCAAPPGRLARPCAMPSNRRAAATAAALVGGDNVRRDLLPSMAAEDFAWFLEQRPGAYIWIGNGAGADQAMLHNPHYDVNDEILALGASYWARLAESVLEKPVG